MADRTDAVRDIQEFERIRQAKEEVKRKREDRRKSATGESERKQECSDADEVSPPEKAQATLTPQKPSGSRPAPSPSIRSKVLVDPAIAQAAAKEGYYVRDCDWSKANWDLPQLQRLRNLSELSAHDMIPSIQGPDCQEQSPQSADGSPSRRRLEDLDGEQDARLPLEHVKTVPVSQLSRRAQGIDMDPNLKVDQKRDLSRVEVSAMVQPPRVDHVSPVVLEMKQLLGLSRHSTQNDPKFQQLLGHLANRHEKDSNVTQMMVKSDVRYTSLSKAKLLQEGEDASPLTPHAASSGLSEPRYRSGNLQAVDYNHGFHSSDIKAFPSIYGDMERRDLIRLSVEKKVGDDEASGLRPKQGWELVPVHQNVVGSSALVTNADLANQPLLEDPKLLVSKLPDLPPTMHQTRDGYRTWMERHLDNRCEDENDEQFEDYLDALTSAKGVELALAQRLESLSKDGSPYRVRFLKDQLKEKDLLAIEPRHE